MRIIKKGLCLLISAVISFSLTSCGEEKKMFYDEKYTTSAGEMTISLAYSKGENEGEFTDKELSEIIKNAADSFESVYAVYSSPDTYKYLNGETDKIFDCDPDVLSFISDAFAFSEKTEGRYEPAAGAASEENGSEHIGKDKFTFDGTTVIKNDKFAKIDPGAYVFARALDASVDALLSSKAVSGRLSFDGVAVVFGAKPDGTSFTVGLHSGDKTDGYFRITDGCIVSTDEKSCMKYPAQDKGDFSRVSVFSPDPVECVMLSRILYGMTEKEVGELYDSGRFTFEAVMTKKDGKTVKTKKAADLGLYVDETSGGAADE